MTNLWKDSEQQDTTGASIWLWGKYVAPVVLDLIETGTLLWRQICLPAFKAFGSLVVIVIKACFFVGFGILNPSKPQSKLEEKFAALEALDNHNTHRLPTESTLQLRKIQGAIGDNWASTVPQSPHVHTGKAERWASVQRKPSNTVMTNPWANLEPYASKQMQARHAPSRNAPGQNEEIMDLDGLFDRPMTGLMMDQPLPGAKTHSQHTKKDRKPLTKLRFEAKPKVAHVKQLPMEHTDPAACNCGRPIVKPEMVHTAEYSLPLMALDHQSDVPMAPKEQYGIPVYAETPSSDRHHLPELGGGNAGYNPDTRLDTTNSDEAAISHFHNFDPLPDYEPWIGKPLPGDNSGPPPNQASALSSDSSKNEHEPELPPLQAAPPVKKIYPKPMAHNRLDTPQPDYPPNNVPWFAQEGENHLSASNLSALNHAPASNVPWSAPEKPIKPVEAKPQPAPIIRPVEQTAPPPLPKPLPPAPLPITQPEPLRLDHELEDDLSGFDYMLQNNRILSNSISNLVDSYFRNASQEEEPNFY